MITAGTTFGSDVDDVDALVDDPLDLLVRWLPRTTANCAPSPPWPRWAATDCRRCDTCW